MVPEVTYLDGHDVSQPDPQVVSDHSVHSDLEGERSGCSGTENKKQETKSHHSSLVVAHGLVAEDDTHRLLPLLALQPDRVTAEQLKLVHLGVKCGKPIDNYLKIF